MRVDVGAAGPPGLQVQVDLEASLRLSGVRDLDDDGSVTVGAGFAIGMPEKLE